MPTSYYSAIPFCLALMSFGSLTSQAQIGSFDATGTRVHVQGPILGFNTSTSDRTDASTGQITGKRQHEPVTITRVVDASSALLLQYLNANEVIKTVTIQLNKAGSKNGYLTIQLTNAVVSKINIFEGTATSNPRVPDSEPVEEISFTYQKIQYSYSDTKIVATDDWSAMASPRKR
jgi:type VI secretion system secreted protein Hcp